jgi:small-conductance mechanosensitive channel
MNFWKEHVVLRLVLIAAFFVVGIALVIGGWKMTGEMSGLIRMVIGVLLLLAALYIYNKPYTTPSR